MTAFQPAPATNPSKDANGRTGGASNEHVPLHSMGDGSSFSSGATSPHAEQGSGGKRRTVTTAKAQFAAAVSSGVGELMLRWGYSRERATSLLLQEIRRDEEPPSDREVFGVMKSVGVGVDDAAKTVAVAKAVQRARVERGLSAVEAIDDLTLKLNASSLLGRVEPDSSLAPISEKGVKCPKSTVSWTEPRRPEDVSSRPPAALHVSRASSARKNHGMKHVHKSGKVKTPSKGARKRTLASSKDEVGVATLDPTGLGVKGNVQQRADEVDAEIAKKAKMTHEEGNVSMDNLSRTKSPAPAVARTKRALRGGDDQQLQDDQPPIKRARGPSEV